MIEKENELIHRFNQIFWLYLFGAVVFIIMAILLVIFKNKLLEKFNKTIISQMVLYGIACFIFVVGIFFSIITYSYSKDIKYVKQREFVALTGTVEDYSRAVSIGDIATEALYYGPIIREEGSVKTIRLNVPEAKLGKRYTFIYLPNSHLAVIVGEIL